ncbi:MAG: class F sortase [Chloroflexota bacterium]
MFRRIIVLFALLVLTSCGDNAEPTSETTSAAPAPVPTITETTTAELTVAEPETLTIPAIDLEAELVGVGLNEDGSMETPEYDQNLAGWYTEGPPPGEPGPAVIAAHVDSQTGPDTFARLHELEPGDEVIVTDEEGQEYTWTVERQERSDRTELPYDSIWNDTDDAVLRLITCAGAYVDGSYVENLIVYAE